MYKYAIEFDISIKVSSCTSLKCYENTKQNYHKVMILTYSKLWHKARQPVTSNAVLSAC